MLSISFYMGNCGSAIEYSKYFRPVSLLETNQGSAHTVQEPVQMVVPPQRADQKEVERICDEFVASECNLGETEYTPVREFSLALTLFFHTKGFSDFRNEERFRFYDRDFHVSTRLHVSSTFKMPPESWWYDRHGIIASCDYDVDFIMGVSLKKTRCTCVSVHEPRLQEMERMLEEVYCAPGMPGYMQAAERWEANVIVTTA